MSSVETLAYFLEEDSLRGVMRDWPEAMQLMVRLDGAGRCELLVHHRDEAGRVLETLREALGANMESLDSAAGAQQCFEPSSPCSSAVTARKMTERRGRSSASTNARAISNNPAVPVALSAAPLKI